MKNIKTRDLIYCALFAALTAIGAFLHFQLFQATITLQFFFTAMAGLLLGAKLGAAQKAAKGAETQIEELQEQVKKLEEEKKAAEDAANEPDEKLPGEDTPAVDPNETKEPDTSVSDSKRKVGWLDLTGHSEVCLLYTSPSPRD